MKSSTESPWLAKQTEPLTMRDLEVDGAVAELEAAEAEVRAVQLRVMTFAPLVPRQVQERRGLGERQEPAGAKQTCDLGHRHRGIAEAHRPVIAEDDVERRVPEGDCLPAGGDERDGNTRGIAIRDRVLQLPERLVEPDRPGRPCRQR